MPTVDLTTSQTWTVPNVTSLDVSMVGGGAGGGARNLALGGGGGGGEGVDNPALVVTRGEGLTITIGASGAAAIIQAAGSAGTATSVKRGATTLVLAQPGSGGGTSAGGAGGPTTGTGTTQTAGAAGGSAISGGAGGLAGLAFAGGYGDGGSGGDITNGPAAVSGAGGIVRLVWVTPTVPADAIAFSAAIGEVTFKHQGRLDAASMPFALSLGDVTFKHQGRLVADAIALNLSLGEVTFGRTTRLAADPISYALSLGAVTFSTSGGTPPVTPTNLVLPNRSPSTRSIQATWPSLVFRQNDTIVGRTQKLELMREKVSAAFTRTMMISIVDGLSTADPTEPLLRLQLLEAMKIGTITANAGNAATVPTAFIVKKNGAANGTITFTGATGVATGITDYLAGALFEIYPPATADATLDDVSISIPVTIG